MMVIRSTRAWMYSLGGTINRKTGSRAFDVSTGNNLYASLLKNHSFFAGESEVVSTQERATEIVFLDTAIRLRKYAQDRIIVLRTISIFGFAFLRFATPRMGVELFCQRWCAGSGYVPSELSLCFAC